MYTANLKRNLHTNINKKALKMRKCKIVWSMIIHYHIGQCEYSTNPQNKKKTPEETLLKYVTTTDGKIPARIKH